MTITEETNEGDPSLLQIWENQHGKIWIQVGYDEMEPHGMHGIAITKEDARALTKEITRLLNIMEEPKNINKPEPSHQLKISKVNWGK